MLKLTISSGESLEIRQAYGMKRRCSIQLRAWINGGYVGLEDPHWEAANHPYFSRTFHFPFFLTIHFGVTHGTWKPRSAEDYLFSKSIGTLNPPRFGAILGAKQLRPGRDMRGAFSTGEACAGYVPHQLCFLFNLCTAKRIVSYMRW